MYAVHVNGYTVEYKPSSNQVSCRICRNLINQGETIYRIPDELHRTLRWKYPQRYQGKPQIWLHAQCAKAFIESCPEKESVIPEITFDDVKKDLDHVCSQKEQKEIDLKPIQDQIDLLKTDLNTLQSVTARNLHEIKEQIKELDLTRPVHNTFHIGQTEPIHVEGKLRKEVPILLKMIQARVNVFMVGPTGSGKTYLAGQIAHILKRPFGAISCNSQMTNWDILGKVDIVDGNTHFTKSLFTEMYETGGVFLFDEITGSNHEVLLAINMGLSNDSIFVDGHEIKKHPDAVILSAGNTWGHGPDRQYCGNTQLDAATLDRFCMGKLYIGYDKELEEQLCPDVALRNSLWHIREKIMSNGLRKIMSTRTMIACFQYLQVGLTQSEILDIYFQDWSRDELSKVGR